MVFLKHQLLQAPNTNQVVIFLGNCPNNSSHVWVVKVDHTNKPVVDWWTATMLTYLTTKSEQKYIPKGIAIAYGKFINKNSPVNPYFFKETESPSPELMERFADYIREITIKV